MGVAGTERPSPTLHISCQTISVQILKESNTVRKVFVEDQVQKYKCLRKSFQVGFMEEKSLCFAAAFKTQVTKDRY